MATITVSSKGQIVLPAATRRRLGLGTGARLEITEEADGLRIRVIKPIKQSDLSHLVGMAKAKASGVPRRLADFDPAAMLDRKKA